MYFTSAGIITSKLLDSVVLNEYNERMFDSQNRSGLLGGSLDPPDSYEPFRESLYSIVGDLTGL